jgi:hypothetical protein
MAVYRRGQTYWYEFVFAGKRIRESAKTTRRTIAREAEKNRRLSLERTLAGIPAGNKRDQIRSVAEIAASYLKDFAADHAAKTTISAKGSLAHVTKHIGNVLAADVSEACIRSYITTRKAESAGNRSINMEIAELSRAIGRTWRELWPTINKLSENSDIGRACRP